MYQTGDPLRVQMLANGGILGSAIAHSPDHDRQPMRVQAAH
jgi:hypothetical protein